MATVSNDRLSEFLTDKEIEALEESENVLGDIVKSMTQDGHVPVKSGEVRVLKEVLESRTSHIMSKAKLRKESKTSDDDNQFRQLAVGILAETAKRRSARTTTVAGLPDAMMPQDIVEGEIVTDHIDLQLTDFVKGDEDV